MSGEVNILKIDYSGSSRNSESSDVAFTVIGDDKYYEKNRYTGKESKKNFEKKIINLSSMSEDFVSKLDEKLKNLEDNETKRKKKNFKCNKIDQRPLFITTVKTGIFLDPPPELAALLGYPPRSNASSGSNNSEKSSDGLMYSFSSQPRVLNKTKPKINNDKQNLNNEKQEIKNNMRQKREINTKKKEMPPPEVIPYGNIMYDRRVVRGPAFMHQPLPTMGMQSPAARQAEARRRAMARRKAQTTRARNLRLRLGTPPPVEGRKHEDIQTEEYLEELFEHPPTEHVVTQTDYFVDRPPTPTFVPMKTGVDASTQIYQGELFHFDVEVKPILEVLVGKTLEQSLIEVMEEDELAAIKEQQQKFKDLRDSEKAEEARLEEEEARRFKEMEIRAIEQEEGLMSQRAAEDRIAAAVLTTGYIADLLPTVVKDLNKGGFLYDEVRQEVDEKFMPWLMQEVKTELQKVVENKDLLSDILREIIDTRAEMYAAIGDKALIEEETAEEEETSSPFPQIEAEEGEEETQEEEESKDVN